MSTLAVQQLDFLPDKFRHAVRRRRASYWRVVVVFMFVGVFAAAAWGLQAVRGIVRREFQQTAARFTAAQAQETLLKQREARLAELRAYADLVTFLRHPWPRSQLVEQLFEPLPDSVIIHKLHLGNEPRPVVASGEASAAAQSESTPTADATTDLADLRKGMEANEVVIHLEGTTVDQPELHAYLHRLTGCKLFRRAQVESIEAAAAIGEADGAKNAASRFTARIVVRSGWGLTDGPSIDELTATTEPPLFDSTPELALPDLSERGGSQ